MTKEEGKKYIDTGWDFKKADTKLLTHGLHKYPAMMIPQIARRLIEIYGEEGNTLLDPFCGTGTSLVEARVAGLDAYGFDINPLARLIAKVKTTPIDLDKVKKEFQSLEEEVTKSYFRLDMEKVDVETPSFFNIDYWFSPDVIKRLAVLKNQIDKINSQDVKDFFLVSFSLVVRKSSYTRNGEFKLYRIPKKRMESFNPDVWGLFKEEVQKNIKGMQDFLSVYDKDTFVEIDKCDSREKTKLDEDSIDLVVTSPPYGDSRTTVAYGQFSRLSLQWMGYSDANKIDKWSLGGIPSEDLNHAIPSPTLDNIIKEISQKDEKRSRDVLSFYYDLNLCTKEISRVMKEGGFVCMVVGNRTVKGIQIPTDQIIVEIGQKHNFEHQRTIVRNIPNKRMPSKNSPTNVKGKKGKTMLKEGIVVLKRI